MNVLFGCAAAAGAGMLLGVGFAVLMIATADKRLASW